MIRPADWHTQTIEEIQSKLISNRNVLALAILGSALQSHDQFDEWSDLDFLLVVRDGAYSQFYPAMDWIQFGDVFATQQSHSNSHSTTRVCFADFRRIDFIVTTRSQVNHVDGWQVIPFWRGTRLLFSHSEQITRLLRQTWSPPTPTFPAQAEFDNMVNHFWFKATLACHKVIRNDRLIALHLALDLVRDCCVVGMILRDRNKGTNYHREGGEGNKVAERLKDTCKVPDILNIIERSAVEFDQLASEWSPSYQEKRHPLIEWLGYIRQSPTFA